MLFPFVNPFDYEFSIIHWNQTQKISYECLDPERGSLTKIKTLFDGKFYSVDFNVSLFLWKKQVSIEWSNRRQSCFHSFWTGLVYVFGIIIWDYCSFDLGWSGRFTQVTHFTLVVTRDGYLRKFCLKFIPIIRQDIVLIRIIKWK